VSFEPAQTEDADRFIRERLIPRAMDLPALPDGVAPLLLIATDGELYGHHQPFREHFLARLVGANAPDDLPYERVSLGQLILDAAGGDLPRGVVHEPTSWSCHHGVDRWSRACDCVADGAWKTPLRIALTRLAEGIDEGTERLVRTLPGAPDPWAARDDYVEVVIGAEAPVSFARRWLGDAPTTAQRTTLLDVMAAQRWRLAMFASCAWFWEDPERPETAGSLRAAVRAARLIDGEAGSDLEHRLMTDLAAVTGPTGVAGPGLVAAALAAVGQRPRASV
jgi:hypothetical protein